MKFLEYIEDKRLQFLIVFIILGFSLFLTYKKNNVNSRIKSYNTVTIGKIIKHKEVDGSYYIHYSYEVNSRKFIKSVNYVGKYVDCYITRKCIGKKFVVYYNPKNPEEAYIDFDDER